ncbi:plasma-membrane proton-efflux P-type ATPase [Desulfosarcina ovata subsp. sediminis]|uniref:Plasma-membrane proton-efflux P-type ATPase n=1 Tax=Desulfosarcina ovata subsp. sediminis TaxID=885957 RepID=A0A5K7ZSW6_9BACT|nr:plasma-membrane proton-efflux P-type ATPase [Desulfosarcina ovata]BBO83300.1 plasma-membrane proton-efflux P-type ATPase [Desulfosarcina ovata subsp. sediminis]
MDESQITTKAAQPLSTDELMQRLDANWQGLSNADAAKRLDRFGANEITEKTISPFLKFLGYLWGPIPWMIEAAAILSLIVHHWVDLGIIVTLLLFNAGVGFWQEYQAGNAVAALKNKLALKCRVLREGIWKPMPARELVPGDVIRLRAGDIIPADTKLIDGDYLSVDQSALTGESLPAGKEKGDVVYSGSIARQGEMLALVTTTGGQTYFGQTARLVAGAGKASHFQKAVLQIGDHLIYLSLGLVAVLIIVQLFRGAGFTELLQFALILTVASIPVAMPAVLSVTMAVGAVALSKMKAIVSRLASVEEMAGMDILCSDKTGTLTQNRLTLGKPQTFGAADVGELILTAALASKAENNDSIDSAVIGALEDPTALDDYRALGFVPFDPVGKRTEATIRAADGRHFKVTKGAPQVIMDLAGLDPQTRSKAETIVATMARKGLRTLGVARTQGEDDAWQFMGILPLFDPPREDSAETIAQARTHGIKVKMVTGDNIAIAREIAGNLGMGKNIQDADRLLAETRSSDDDLAARTEAADGFAQVFPEHKYRIVKALQDKGHIVGMTGDGVNDAPALKQADVGIAVSGATDAARAAADLVLTAPGLSVLVRAVEEARRIFERMNSYAVYRITETIRIMIFVVLAMVVFNFYPITAIMIILLAFLNDVPIMTIAYDNTGLEPGPVRWDMHRIIAVSTVMGLTGVAGSFLMLYIALDLLHLTIPQVQTYIFLKMAVSGHLTLFVARSKGFFLKKPYPAPVMIWSALATKVIGTLLAAYGFGLITPIHWREIALIWGYSIVWAFFTDWAKTLVYRHFNMQGRRHEHFLGTLHGPLTPHSTHGGVQP